MGATTASHARKIDSRNMEVIGFIADHPTPKIHLGGGVAYTVNSRDYKGVMIVVLASDHSESVGLSRQPDRGQHRNLSND